MPLWLAVVGAAVLIAVGVWTFVHPNGGYRAVGGVGSGLSPGTRRWAGLALVVFAVLVLVLVVSESVVIRSR